jgi:hypothetical protein
MTRRRLARAEASRTAARRADRSHVGGEAVSGSASGDAGLAVAGRWGGTAATCSSRASRTAARRTDRSHVGGEAVSGSAVGTARCRGGGCRSRGPSLRDVRALVRGQPLPCGREPRRPAHVFAVPRSVVPPSPSPTLERITTGREPDLSACSPAGNVPVAAGASRRDGRRPRDRSVPATIPRRPTRPAPRAARASGLRAHPPARRTPGYRRSPRVDTPSHRPRSEAPGAHRR